jgi:DNA-binding CsgD family transcriptional regulator
VALLDWRGVPVNREHFMVRCGVVGVRKSLGAARPLSRKQRRILALVGEGRSNKEIATALGVEVSTVKAHLQRVFDRLGAVNRTHAFVLSQKFKMAA